MILCPRCLQETQEPYGHQLQDGWECDNLQSPMLSCTNCSRPVVNGWDHQRNGVFTCSPDQTISPVSEGERRIINALGTENSTDSVLWQLAQIRKALGATTKNEHQLDMRAASEFLTRQEAKIEEQAIEIEFLKIKVEELQARLKESCRNGNGAAC